MRASDAAVTRTGVPADQIAQRLIMYKTKTEAKLEKERQTKIQKELEKMSQPNINSARQFQHLNQRTPIYDRVDDLL